MHVIHGLPPCARRPPSAGGRIVRCRTDSRIETASSLMAFRYRPSSSCSSRARCFRSDLLHPQVLMGKLAILGERRARGAAFRRAPRFELRQGLAIAAPRNPHEAQREHECRHRPLIELVVLPAPGVLKDALRSARSTRRAPRQTKRDDRSERDVPPCGELYRGRRRQGLGG